MIGGIIGGIDAIRDKRNFWDGTICKSKMKIPQYNQYGPYDCRYEVFKSFDKCFNGSTKSTGSLRMTYPHVEVDQNMMRDMYAARRFNLKKISADDIQDLVAIMKQGKGISLETLVDGTNGHAVGVKSIKVYPNKWVIRVMNPEVSGYKKLYNFDKIINAWQITHY